MLTAIYRVAITHDIPSRAALKNTRCQRTKSAGRRGAWYSV